MRKWKDDLNLSALSDSGEQRGSQYRQKIFQMSTAIHKQLHIYRGISVDTSKITPVSDLKS